MNNQQVQEFIRIAEEYNSKCCSRDERETDVKKFNAAPHCWLLGAVMDRGIPFAKAWNIPFEIANREFEGDTSFAKFSSLSKYAYYRIFDTPPYLHRYKSIMAKNFYLAVQKIKNEYSSDASNIWRGNLSSFEVVSRLKEFKGVGDKIATMCCNILYRDLGIVFSDLRAINVSPDIHVKRVFYRLGLVNRIQEDPRIIMSVARNLHSKYPGVFDLVCWMVGQEGICVNDINKCKCEKCPLSRICLKQNLLV